MKVQEQVYVKDKCDSEQKQEPVHKHNTHKCLQNMENYVSTCLNVVSVPEGKNDRGGIERQQKVLHDPGWPRSAHAESDPA